MVTVEVLQLHQTEIAHQDLQKRPMVTVEVLQLHQSEIQYAHQEAEN
jgi:hypothetical protein